jgi:hypothetical protein
MTAQVDGGRTRHRMLLSAWSRVPVNSLPTIALDSQVVRRKVEVARATSQE